MSRINTYVLVLLLFQLTGCFDGSVYRKGDDVAAFGPREYYRKHISFTDAGFFRASSLAEEMEREITKEELVKHAIVIKQEQGYEVAIKMKAYHYKKAREISERYKKNWEAKWKVPVRITFSPEEYRRTEKISRIKKRA
jgi:hypothetical protein